MREEAIFLSLYLDKKFDEVRSAWVLVPSGDIDIYSAPEFKKELIGLIDEKDSDVIIDGEKLDYIDSTGLGVLISGLKRIRLNDKTIIIENIKPNISKLFDITGLNKVFVMK